MTDEQKRELYLRQRHLLDTFLEHGAISRAQYEKSLGDLTEKMGMTDQPGEEGQDERADTVPDRSVMNRMEGKGKHG